MTFNEQMCPHFWLVAHIKWVLIDWLIFFPWWLIVSVWKQWYHYIDKHLTNIQAASGLTWRNMWTGWSLNLMCYPIWPYTSTKSGSLEPENPLTTLIQISFMWVSQLFKYWKKLYLKGCNNILVIFWSQWAFNSLFLSQKKRKEKSTDTVATWLIVIFLITRVIP